MSIPVQLLIAPRASLHSIWQFVAQALNPNQSPSHLAIALVLSGWTRLKYRIDELKMCDTMFNLLKSLCMSDGLIPDPESSTSILTMMVSAADSFGILELLRNFEHDFLLPFSSISCSVSCWLRCDAVSGYRGFSSTVSSAGLGCSVWSKFPPGGTTGSTSFVRIQILPPLSVNLHALLEMKYWKLYWDLSRKETYLARFVTTCLNRTSSPVTTPGIFGLSSIYRRITSMSSPSAW